MRIASFALILVPAMFAADTWPQFRGPDGNATAKGPAPTEFGPGKNLLWKTAVPIGQSSAAIWGDRIFITSGDKNTKKLETIAVNRKSGEVIWRQAVEAEKIENLHAIGNPASGTPAADAEHVYVYFGSYGAIAYDHNGKTVWDEKLPVPSKRQGGGTSPLIAGDLVLINRDDPEDAYLLALDKKTGKRIWKTSYDAPNKSPGVANTSTPVLWKGQVVVHRATEVAAFDAKSGEKKWNVRVRSTGIATPVSTPDAMFVSTWNNFGEEELRVPMASWEEMVKGDKDGDGLLTVEEMPGTMELARRPDSTVEGTTLALPTKMLFGQLDGNKDSKIAKEEWAAAIAQRTARFAGSEHGLIGIKAGGAGDVTQTHVLWRESKSVGEVPSPVFSNGRVYMVTNGGIVTCVDAASGKVLYRGRIGAPGSYFSSPVVADGKVYFSSSEGVIVAIKDADKLEVLARNDLGETIYATPAIVDGVMYTRTASHLYAFGPSK